MGMPMSEGQPQAGPSCVTPVTCSSVGRVQAESAAPAPPTTTTSTSLHKGKECQTSPAPTRTVLPYEDNQMDDLVQGPNAFDLVQGTLFPELLGQEPQVVILGDDSNTKGVRTLFARMGNYIYAYQGEAISNAIINYNNGHVLSIPTVKTGSTPELSPERPEISVRRDLASATRRGALHPCQVFVPDFGTRR